MGGDHAPETNIEGAIDAVSRYPISITLVGILPQLEKALKKHPQFPHDRISLRHASEVVSMSESPTLSFRKKKDSSIRVGLNMVKNGEAHAFVSAGNTGAMMTSSVFVLGRLPQVERPVLAAVFPSENKPFVLLDMGSSVDCKASHLEQFAVMGHHFSKEILEKDNPEVALLNIGEEEDKGNALTREAFSLLQNSSLNFIGNIEAKAMMKGKADVVVCDGFVGNAILKFGEGISKAFIDFFKKESKTSLLSLIGLALLKPAFKRFKKKFDYDEYGGAHLLGLHGISIVAHGSAKPKAIRNAIKTAMRGVEHNMVEKIKAALADNHPEKK